MTEPSPQRPVPGPPRPGPVDNAAATDAAPTTGAARATDAAPATDAAAFDDLDGRPVAEHVEIFEAEHARLRDELSTIDQL